MSTEYQVSARKYRPGSFAQVVGQPHVVQTIKNAIGRDRIAHAYVFSGMRGVGKTTVARIVAKALNCEKGPTSEPCESCDSCDEITRGQSVDVIEIDGASNTGVDDVRELRENVKFSPFRGKYRVYIIDEVHMLSNSAFNALLKTLEEPPNHAVFIFATTEVHKIPATILSRCQHFTFRRISRLEIIRQLQHVASQTGTAIEEKSLAVIARASDGSMRDALSLLDQAIAFGGEQVRHEDLEALLGSVPDELVRSLVQAVISQDAAAGIDSVGQAFAQGYDLRLYCREVVERLRNVLVAAVVSSPEQVQSLIELPAEEVETTIAQAREVSEAFLQGAFDVFTKAEDRMRMSAHPRFLLEAAVVQATLFDQGAQRVEPQSQPAGTGEAAGISKFQQTPSTISDKPKAISSQKPERTQPVRQHIQTSPNSPARDSLQVDRKMAARPMEQRKQEPQKPPSQIPRQEVSSLAASPTSEKSSVDWGKVMDRLMEDHPNIGTFVEMGTLVQVDPEQVVIGYPKHASVARWRTDKPENRALVAKVCQQVAGHAINVRVVELESSQATAMTIGQTRAQEQNKEDQSLIDEARTNPIVKQTLEMFGGEVVSARRLSPKEENV
ncbi:MAG: DNA polymerase III subunit gamma/tau [Nitrospirales bacterium]|nr:DNA polymerase III subunit gamma/tau [Nitrospira sp.]MDR4501050.1 DNA polymerase III subunit gamma/tau [Nitrospirales bacterium]